MLKRTMIALMVAGGLTMQAPLVWAEEADEQVNVAEKAAVESQEPTAVQRLRTASDLVAQARDSFSPVLMVAAVELILQANPQEDAERFADHSTEPLEDGAADQDAAEKDEVAADAGLNPEALLEEARAWAEGDDALLALLDHSAEAVASLDSAVMGRLVSLGA